MFKKFDRTPHVPWSGKVSKDDRMLSVEAFRKALSAGTLLVQEKIDGASLGVSYKDGILQLQSRGHLLIGGDHPQFSPAWGHFYLLSDTLKEVLGETKVLFGEWLYYVHHLHYDKLPGWFIAYDIYDKEKEYYLSKKAIHLIPGITCLEWIREVDFNGSIFGMTGNHIYEYLNNVTEFTPYSSMGKAEGLYFRIEDDEKVLTRAKFVRKDFFPVDEEAFVTKRNHSLNEVKNNLW